ncbi:2Fe-2S iron-sulfur cluster-binding protein [bacterium]|nr:2Fe-2S iron-sulfur cluster-binding protein [bacterium]MCI0604696.1 2Fe-2S iron-sulfur cluster-binding protein [bacterium]
MGGSNPYIKTGDIVLPKTKYSIRFEPEDPSMGEAVTIEVDPERIPYHETGQPGSILSTALASGIDIEHSCGGVCACSTCHIIVKEGLDTCNEATDDELDQLEEARGLTMQSRLSCQTVPDGTKDVRIVIPAWNVNLVKETPH